MNPIPGVQIFACKSKGGHGFAVWTLEEDDMPSMTQAMMDGMLASMEVSGALKSEAVAAARAKADQLAAASSASRRSLAYQLHFCATVEEALEIVRACLMIGAPKIQDKVGDQ